MKLPKSKRIIHAQCHLPPLDPHEALLLVNILERAIHAIWRTHGDQMADRLAAQGIETPRPEDAVFSGYPSNDNLPF